MLDPERVRAALRRRDEALRNARYHDKRAAAERAKAAQIENTWSLEPAGDDLTEDPGEE